jgi:hypothetical protein
MMMTTSQQFITQGRDANEPEIIAAFQAAGASVVKIHEYADLLIGYQGVTLLVEVKTLTGKFKPRQLDFQRDWRGQYWVVRSVEAALELIEATRKMVECLDGQAN